MSRGHDKGVTEVERLAILVEVSQHEAMGSVTFPVTGARPVPVRPLTIKDLRTALRRLAKPEAKRFSALLALKGALESRDKIALERAMTLLEHAWHAKQLQIKGFSAEFHKMNRKLEAQTKKFRQILGMNEDEVSLKRKMEPAALLAYEVSHTLAETHIALWWSHGTFRPVIFCPSEEHALYVHTFIVAPRSERGFRICAHCSSQFLQQRPNQDYCCPAHREAHRVARWRKQRSATATVSQKEGKHGSSKAR